MFKAAHVFNVVFLNKYFHICFKNFHYIYRWKTETDKLCRVPPYDIIHVAKLVHSVVKYVKRTVQQCTHFLSKTYAAFRLFHIFCNFCKQSSNFLAQTQLQHSSHNYFILYELITFGVGFYDLMDKNPLAFRRYSGNDFKPLKSLKGNINLSSFTSL